MTDAEAEIYSLLVPLAEHRLLVPRVCIAEVAAWAQPAPIPGAMPWLLGTVEWSGRTVPLLSFEGACDQDMPTVTSRTRIVIFYTVAGRIESGFFGLVTQGFPQLVRVSPAVLEAEPDADWPDTGPVMCQVRMVNQHPLIPDIERIENLIADNLAVVDAG